MDSIILVRERAQGSNLEAEFQKKRGRILDETEHTLTFLPEGKKAIKRAERDVTKSYSPPHEAEPVKQLEKSKRRNVSIYSPPVEAIEVDEMSDCEMTRSSEMTEIESSASSEVTFITTNVDSETDGSEGSSKVI